MKAQSQPEPLRRFPSAFCSLHRTASDRNVSNILKAYYTKGTISFNIKRPILLQVFAFNTSVPLCIYFPGTVQVLQGNSKDNFQQWLGSLTMGLLNNIAKQTDRYLLKLLL